MHSSQLRLLPDARPLVDRLGVEFFRSLPENSGVYLLRDASDTVLYVGKARNLRRRLHSYRVANPESMPRRRVRLLHLARRIEWEITSDEASAIARERVLIRELKPRFNRAGVWPGPSRQLGWRVSGGGLELAVNPPEPQDWNLHGPLGSGASRTRTICVRLLGCGWYPEGGTGTFPAGWLQGRLPTVVRLDPGPAGPGAPTVAPWLSELLEGRPEAMRAWLELGAFRVGSPFVRALLTADLDWMAERKPPGGNRPLTCDGGST